MRRPLAFLIVFVLSVGLASIAPVSANCGTNSLITSISPNNRSFVFNPTFANHPSFGYTPHGVPYVFSTDPANPAPQPLSPAAKITFWGLGAGDPTTDLGIDNGAYDMIEGNGFYFYSFTNSDTPGGLHYGGQLFGTWDSGTDNCVGRDACMCVLFTDHDGQYGSYALAGAMADANVNTFINRKGTDNSHGTNLPIVLVDILAPTIIASTSVAGTDDVEFDIRVEAAPLGDYVQDGCACGPIGFKILQQIVPRGVTPAGPESSHWSDSRPTTGGSQPPTSLGNTVRVESACTDNTDLYFATRLVFDSGFESKVVSAPTRIRCP